MPFAVTLRLDCSSGVLIEDIWRVLAAEGLDSDRLQLGYAPHVTLGIYPDDVGADLLLAGLSKVVVGWRALPVVLSAIGIFPGPSSIIWAAPVVTRDLLAVQAGLLDALADLPVHPHYRPDAWVPHVTLTGLVLDPGRAVNALLRHWRPIVGVLDQVDLVRFRPVEVLQSHVLV
jgi:2'-5' RNA ligase